jgi:hypothetical protein
VETLAGEEHVDIAVPPAAVWAYRLDFSNLPAYNRDVSGVERIAAGSGDGGEAGAGARYRFQLDTARGPHPVELAVTEAVDSVRVAATMTGSMTANEVFTVGGLDDDRITHATLILWLDVPDGLDTGTVQAMLDSGRAQIRGELDRMRHNLEAARA